MSTQQLHAHTFLFYYRRVYVLNITGATYDARILAQTLSGIVAQRAPEMFLLDAAVGPGPGGENLAQWHLDLLPLTTSQKHYEHAFDVGALLKLFWPATF